ncbi:hypothetical protein CO2235_200147 [Cupriavidus oxalaticus]|uniref:Uncharacterized protein n=1 Tax=Cupriavidus oxalaticus TaxID=96344 RepID=A0A375FNG9_9BURK|nr:hypothetical protein CO2235_U850017 [Cupriavidus oxalaticus]SPC14291.1 hypothetical protein CO2235_200147 [Cupriavidus oxalaticus]
MDFVIENLSNYFASICSFVTDIPWLGYMRLQKEEGSM